MTEDLDLSGATFKDLAMAFTNFFSNWKLSEVTESEESTKTTTSAIMFSGGGALKEKRN